MSYVDELRVRDLSLHFGGVRALDSVTFTVAPGSIHSIIGPNGAGKSSCFNVISGLYRATAGSVHYGNHSLTTMPPWKRARHGIGRAFQNVALSPHESVLDTVMVGRHHLTSGGFLAAGLAFPWTARQQRIHRERAREICVFMGLEEFLDTPVGTLSYGNAKRVDIARALATEPGLLMLDEPAAGMNATETAGLGELILRIREALGISILLVEHDMALVMAISDRITAIDFGTVLCDGLPGEVRTDPAVIRAYLGASADTEHGLLVETEETS